jgi:hypothetical protein
VRRASAESREALLGEVDAGQHAVVIEDPDRARTYRHRVRRDARHINEGLDLAGLRIEQRQRPRSYTRSSVVPKEPQPKSLTVGAAAGSVDGGNGVTDPIG